MTWAILVGNIKGGTGKSTVTQEVAYSLRDSGYDVGVMDADIDSANLATRFGTDKKVTFEGDHMVKPVEVDGINLYSMENAFEDSSFSQTGEFMGEVVKTMVESSMWGDLDYLVVDCPPGSSDVFDQLVKALRANILGAISVGVSNAVDDTARFAKVCGHNWVPILGFIENMSGMYCHGEEVKCPETGYPVKPHGKGDIKKFCKNVGGNFIGHIPLCADSTDISDVADDTVSNCITAIEEADQPPLPDDNTGELNFIRNVWSTISSGIKQMNEKIPVGEIQDEFGVEGRDPIVMELELTDAGPISDRIFSKVVVTIDGGNMKVMKPKKAKRKGISVEGGIRITSQDLNNAIKGEKEVMRSVTGEVTTEPYSIVDAVKMGDAEIWGNKTINRLSVMDTILSDVVPMSEIQEAMVK